MNPADFQQWLGTHGRPVVVDGQPGPATRAALLDVFTNPNAPVITATEIDALAQRLGCEPKQIRAVAAVESGRSAFDDQGRPKMLFERHKFFKLTGGRFPLAPWNNPSAGGYGENSWDKLARAACQDVAAAFSSASWGRFQVLGLHWQGLYYSSPLEMAYSTVVSEAAHYDMLARYIERFNLKPALAELSTDPDDNRRFAAAYNGPVYEKFRYHLKLAEAMA